MKFKSKLLITITAVCLFLSNLFSEDFRSYLSYRYFYNAVYNNDVEWVKNHLKAGYDPEKCKGEAGWVDSIPLKVNVETLHSKKVDDQYTDTMIIDLLIQYGADVNRLPYVWDRIYFYKDFKTIEDRYKNNYKKDGILYEGAVQEKEEREWVAKINSAVALPQAVRFGVGACYLYRIAHSVEVGAYAEVLYNESAGPAYGY